VGPRGGLDTAERKRVSCPCRESNPCRPTRIPLALPTELFIYRLSTSRNIGRIYSLNGLAFRPYSARMQQTRLNLPSTRQAAQVIAVTCSVVALLRRTGVHMLYPLFESFCLHCCFNAPLLLMQPLILFIFNKYLFWGSDSGDCEGCCILGC
jgi:hypothetical protein